MYGPPQKGIIAAQKGVSKGTNRPRHAAKREGRMSTVESSVGRHNRMCIAPSLGGDACLSENP